MAGQRTAASPRGRSAAIPWPQSSRASWRRASTAALAFLLAGIFIVATGAGPAALAAARQDLARQGATTGVNSSTMNVSGATPATVATANTSGHAVPLVIVLDLSGSMADSDTNGTVKIEGAKAALTELVRGARVGNELGIWGYPGDDDCHSGGYINGAELDAVGDRTRYIDAIRELSPNGGTPTGQALEAVAADLTSRGYTSASILLVSDGESNCHPPAPCEVAQDLVDAGFDLTVNTVGFQISGAGRDELECIADATDGGYYDVADSEELEEQLSALANPELTVEVEAADLVAAGSAVEIIATVRNESATTVPDARVSLTFEGAGAGTVFPAVLPPRFLLGNIPPQHEVTRTWRLSTFGSAKAQAKWVVTARGDRTIPGSKDGIIEVVEAHPNLTRAGTIVTDALKNGPLVVLGDSYSSGEGAGEYFAGTDTVPDGCHRSNNTYGAQLAGDDDTVILACSGDQIVQLDGPGTGKNKTKLSQFGQLRKLDEAPGAAVMTIGGNDINFEGIVTSCVLAPNCALDVYRDRIFKKIDGLEDRLVTAYVKTAKEINSSAFRRSGGTGKAPLFILSYPQVLPSAWRGKCGPQYPAVPPSFDSIVPMFLAVMLTGPFSPSETRMANDVVARLNAVIDRAVKRAAAEGYGIYHVDTVQQAVLPSHTACDDDPYIKPIYSPSHAVGAKFSGNAAELMHPMQNGHTAIANALITWSQTASYIEPDNQSLPKPIKLISAKKPAGEIVIAAGDQESVTYRAGDGATITVTGLKPGSTVTITMHSDPIVLGRMLADANGVASGIVYFPLDQPVGKHTLTADGIDADDKGFTYDRGLLLLPERPWWWLYAGIGAGIILVAGVGALLVIRRRLRRLKSPGGAAEMPDTGAEVSGTDGGN